MIDQAERVFDSLNRADIGRLLALDHDHRDAQRAGGSDLAVGGRTAAILGDDDLDPVLDQKLAFGRFLEGAGRENVKCMGNIETRRDGVDTADQIAVLRSALEMESFLSADGKENAVWRGAERQGCLWDGADTRPAIAGFLFPLRATQSKKRNASPACCDGRVVRDACRKGMRSIDQKVEFFGSEEIGKPVASTEAAASDRNRLGHGLCRASGQRKQAVVIGAFSQRGRQLPRFGRAGKDQDAVFAHG